MDGYYRTQTSPPFYAPNVYAKLVSDLSLCHDKCISMSAKFYSQDRSKSVMIKKFLTPFESQPTAQRCYRELALLRDLQHDNILKFLGSYALHEGPNSLETIYLVTEFCGKPLSEKIEKGDYSMRDAKKWIRETLKALQYLKANEVIHRDVHPGKICIDSNNKATLIGFGFARMQDNMWQCKRATGSLIELLEQDEGIDMHDPSIVHQNHRYIALEEVIDWRGCDEKVDIWSCSTILCEMITGHHLFGDQNIGSILKSQLDSCGPVAEDVLKKIESNADRKALTEYSRLSKRKDFIQILRKLMKSGRVITEEDINSDEKSLRDFIDNTLQFNPQRRMSAEQALAHPFLKTLQPWETNLPEDEGEALKALRKQIFNQINAKSE